MACLANDLSDSGQTVVAGFSTHPHWDHLLWHARLGAAPRYGTARCAATVRVRLSDARGKARIAELIPGLIWGETDGQIRFHSRGVEVPWGITGSSHAPPQQTWPVTQCSAGSRLQS
jgi:hypothetical protein